MIAGKGLAKFCLFKQSSHKGAILCRIMSCLASDDISDATLVKARSDLVDLPSHRVRGLLVRRASCLLCLVLPVDSRHQVRRQRFGSRSEGAPIRYKKGMVTSTRIPSPLYSLLLVSI